MRVAFYYAVLLLVFAYAAARGGRPEQLGAAIIGVGSLLTHAALSPLASRFGQVELSVLGVDLLALACFLALALKSQRYWPIWVSALQLIGVLAHVARLAEPSMMRPGYAFILAVWSYPMLAIIAAATWRHHRRTRATNSS